MYLLLYRAVQDWLASMVELTVNTATHQSLHKAAPPRGKSPTPSHMQFMWHLPVNHMTRDSYSVWMMRMMIDLQALTLYTANTTSNSLYSTNCIMSSYIVRLYRVQCYYTSLLFYPQPFSTSCKYVQQYNNYHTCIHRAFSLTCSSLLFDCVPCFVVVFVSIKFLCSLWINRKHMLSHR